jgi:putative DNA methylase
MAIVADGKDGRVYLPPNEPHEEVAINAEPIDVPETLLAKNPRDFKTPNYGMTKHRDLFTKRQLVAMTTFCDLVSKARLLTLKDSGHDEDYAAALATYLALASSRCADYWSSICGWHSSRQLIRNTFARQAIPMVWDYAETNPLSNSAGNFSGAIEWVSKCAAAVPASITATAIQGSAGDVHPEQPAVFSTDPPYYDNVGYADLSDYFYIWIRRSLASVYPELFKTVLVPKAEELIADPYRQGGKDSARTYFENGMRRVLEGIRKNSDDRFPTTIFYAFKQTEADEQNEEDLVNNADSHASTGWETFLEGLVESGWQVDGTWPMRTELGNRMIAMDKNALASSIVLVCRPRPQNAGVASRRDFLAALKRELPEALRHLQRGNIAPVDLAQAAIGPGMAVFSRYAKVLETDGSTMSVRSALAEINKCLDEVLAEQEGEFDADTRWALAWFDQNGFNEGAYGVAETLCTAKNTSVQGMKDAGILEAKGGKVRLLKKEELDADWNPAEDSRLTIWEITHHLIRRLEQGESGAAELIQQLGAKAEIARDLSYRLYTICERRKWAQEAIGYNALVLSWSDVQRLAEERKAAATPTQGELI